MEQYNYDAMDSFLDWEDTTSVDCDNNNNNNQHTTTTDSIHPPPVVVPTNTGITQTQTQRHTSTHQYTSTLSHSNSGIGSGQQQQQQYMPAAAADDLFYNLAPGTTTTTTIADHDDHNNQDLNNNNNNNNIQSNNNNMYLQPSSSSPSTAAAALFGNACMNIASLPPMPKQAQAPTGWSGDVPYLFHQMMMPPSLLSANAGNGNGGTTGNVTKNAICASSFAAPSAQAKMTTSKSAGKARAKAGPSLTTTTTKKKGSGSKKKKSPKGGGKGKGNDGVPPPFMLFDAPCELRYNFAQTQQRYNMPLQVGANDFHYGVPVNGFHPQVNAQDNPPVMLDARHCPKQGSSDRNEREQKRAHKITELIEDLRVSMIDGGWNVQVKSKYHTLSTCQDYVRHLIKTTKEKEDEVNRVRQEADMKTFEVSGYEADDSAMSTMTSESSTSRKRKLPKSESLAMTSMSSTFSLTGSTKKSRYDDGLDDDESIPSGPSIDARKIDDSNDDPDESVSIFHKNGTLIKPQEEKNDSSNEPWKVQGDVCYADVFMESNVPQLVATPAGRIIAWNHSLLKLTGASKSDVKRSTIFSLVQLDHLSQLFELVAKALRGGKRDKNTDVVTLPCITFENDELDPIQLYMTVTLINDENPALRCFHCVITDQSGADGKVGYISKELIESMF